MKKKGKATDGVVRLNADYKPTKLFYEVTLIYN